MIVIQLLISFLLAFTSPISVPQELDSAFETVVVEGNKPSKKKEQRLRDSVTKSARKYLGTKYKYGGTSPRGFDCSGFITYVLSQYGYEGGRSSKQLANNGLPVNKHNVKAGDLIFFGNNRSISHVALVSKVHKDEVFIIHSTSSKGVIEESLDDSSYWKSRFMFARNIISKHK